METINSERVNILLFSKFSNACKRFVQILGTVPNIKNKITFLCVDNKQVRQIVKNDKNLQIKVLPCLLRIDDNIGYVETFEGEKAFEILNSYVLQISSVPDTIKKKVSFTTPLNEENEVIFGKNTTPLKFNESIVPVLSESSSGEYKPEKDVAINTFFYVEPDKKEVERPKAEELFKKDTNSIAAKALQMQKEREVSSTPTVNNRQFN